MICILIADPDSATRKALTLLLRHKLGIIEIVEAQDVETLICALVDTTPDFLLLDWRLSGSPAPKTCHLLQKAYPHLKIVLLSVNDNDAGAAKEAGTMFIHKGTFPDKLISTLTLRLQKDKQ